MIKQTIVDFHLIIKSEQSEIAKVEAFIEYICKNLNVGDDTYGNILISLAEAANNAILHGNKLNPEKSATIDCKFDEQTRRLTFLITDEGNGFDYNKLPDPTAPENLDSPSGRGVFLMKQLSDLIIFSNNGTTVEMQFKI